MTTEKGGQPAHVVDENSKTLVKICSGLGMSQVNISKLLGISDATLRNYYEADLDAGKAHVDQLVFSKFIDNIKAGKEASIMFYLRSRLGWKDTQEVKIEGLPPVVVNINFGTHTETISSQPDAPALSAPNVIDLVPNENPPDQC